MITPNDIIYLDNNATTQLDPAVLEEMLPFLTTFYGNPSSGYAFGAQVKVAIDSARERVAALIGCAADEIVFTSGGTESNNTAVNAALQTDARRQHIVTSAVEHSAVWRHCEELARRGCEVTFLPVDRGGHLELGALEEAIGERTAIVSVMWANNETGVLFPVAEAAEIARCKGVFFHTDAVQAVGKVRVDVASSAVTSLALSAHKLHGPKGVGALYVKRGRRFHPTIFGGSQENGRRAGTHNVAAIVALGKAAECAAATLLEEQTRVKQLRDRFEATLLTQVTGTSINGDRAARLPNTSSITFDGIDGDALLIALDARGVCCSAGSACRSGATESSHVLRAMGLSEEGARSTLRFSFGRFNIAAEVDRALQAITSAVGRVRTISGKSGVSIAERGGFPQPS